MRLLLHVVTTALVIAATSFAFAQDVRQVTRAGRLRSQSDARDQFHGFRAITELMHARQGGTIKSAKVHLTKCQHPIQRPPYRDHFAKRQPFSPQLNYVNS